MDDGWDCFGEAPADAPPPKTALPPPSNTADAAAAAAVALFEGADVPEPPPAPDHAAQGSGSVSIWPDAPPLYTGPVRLVEDDGVGGRGFVAERDVHPGELLLLEAPLVAVAVAVAVAGAVAVAVAVIAIVVIVSVVIILVVLLSITGCA